MSAVDGSSRPCELEGEPTGPHDIQGWLWRVLYKPKPECGLARKEGGSYAHPGLASFHRE